MKVFLILFLGVLGLHLFLLFNLQFTAWPEMLSYAFLKNHGFNLYKDLVYPYPPLLTILLSQIYTIFGYKVEVLKITTWIFISINDFLIYIIVKRFTKNNLYILLSVLFYAITQPFLEGNMMWFDLAIVPMILSAIYFLLGSKNTKNLFFAGLFLSLAALIKQTTGIFIILIPIILLSEKNNFKKIMVFLVMPIFTLTILIFYLFLIGTLKEFFNWVIIYPFIYWTKFPGYIQMNIPKGSILTILFLLVPIFILIYKKIAFAEKNLKLLLIFLGVSFLLVYPRFSFFHLQTFIAISAIFFGYLLTRIRKSYLLISLTLIITFAFIDYPILKRDWGKETRFYSSSDKNIINVISQNVAPDENVYLLGLPSSYYGFSNRLPSKPWVDNFGWYLEIPGIQDQIISRWEENKPQKIIWQIPLGGNWYDLGTYQPDKITSWIEKNYIKKQLLADNIWLWENKIILTR